MRAIWIMFLMCSLLCVEGKSSSKHEGKDPGDRRNGKGTLMRSQMKWYGDALDWYSHVLAWRNQVIRALESERWHHVERLMDDGGTSSPGSFQCDRVINLDKKNAAVEFYSPNFYSARPYPSNIKCVYRIFGNATCHPVVNCPVFDIASKQGSDCRKEFLKIHDGYGNSVRFCGKEGPKKSIWMSSKGLRDLFVTFVSGSKEDDDREHVREGFLCIARCHKENANTDVKVLNPIAENPYIENRCYCGLASEGGDRIVGGNSALRGSYPWQAAVVEKGTRKPFCGGSLINDKFVLTASHCFPPDHDTSREENIEVLLHVHVLDASHLETTNPTAVRGEHGWMKSTGWDEGVVTDIDEDTLRFAVKEIIRHPLFTEGMFDYDVALLRLAGRIEFTDDDSPVPVCLPPPGIYEHGEVNATVIGWGVAHEKAATTTRILQELTVPLLNIGRCKAWLPKRNITDRMLCAGFRDGEQDACRADSGGPLMFRVRERFWEQIGIVSWGVGCAKKKKPGFYAKITEMNQWLHHVSNTRDAKWCVRPEK